MKEFLAQKKTQVLDHPAYSPNLTPMRLFLFNILKSVLAGSRNDSRKSLVAAIYQCLKYIHIKDYQRCFRNWNTRLKLCEKVKKDYFEGNKC